MVLHIFLTAGSIVFSNSFGGTINVCVCGPNDGDGDGDGDFDGGYAARDGAGAGAGVWVWVGAEIWLIGGYVSGGKLGVGEMRGTHTACAELTKMIMMRENNEMMMMLGPPIVS